MKPSVNVTSNQPKLLSKREAKKSVNRKSHGVIFFQIGLILSLIATIFAMEINVGSPSNFKPQTGFTLEEFPVKVYTVEKEIPKSEPIAKVVKARPKVQTITEVVKIIKNTTPVIDMPVKTIATTVTTPETPAKSKELDPPIDTNKTRNLHQVEFVPIFPGCESLSTNEEKKACMNSKINAFINKKFRSDRFSGLAKNKTHNIYVQFTINKNGDVEEVVASAPNTDMKKEGIRALSKLPKMTPGKMGTQNVPVSYMVPIAFKVN